MSDNDLNDIDKLLNSMNLPLSDTQNLNNQLGDTNINVDDVLKLTEDYTTDINLGSSKALEFLNSTEKNLNELHIHESSSIKNSNILNEMLNTDTNKTKKEVAYTLFDFDSPVDKSLALRLAEVKDVYRVRIIK